MESRRILCCLRIANLPRYVVVESLQKAVMSELCLQDQTSVVLYHFEALTGLNIRGDIRRRDVLTGVDMFRGTIADAYLLRGDNKTLAVVGDDLKVSSVCYIFISFP
jgi:hypothetical protein